MAKIVSTAGRVSGFTCPTDKAQAFLWDVTAPGLGQRATPAWKPAYVFQGRYQENTIRLDEPQKPLARVLPVDRTPRAISADQKRMLWRGHCEEHTRAFDAWWAVGGVPLRPPMPAFPEVCRGLACGAKTRAGSPCKRTSIFINGRCKLHGGVSTGPTTKRGKARAPRNGLAPKKQSP